MAQLIRESPRARGKPKVSRTNFWRHRVANGWNLERRAQQGKLIHRRKAWERSSGPRTAAGKARVSRNAYKGGTRPLLRELARLLRKQEKVERLLADPR